MHALHKIFIICALAGFTLGAKIIGGQKTKKNEMQYMASVQNQNGHFCGGFLIDEDFVLTAAHCIAKNPTHVVLGTHDIADVDETKKYDVRRCKHRDFRNVTRGNDIMLLRLKRKAELGRITQTATIELPRHKIDLNKKKMCRVAGWGPTKTGCGNVDELRDVEVSVIDYKKCNEQWQYTLPKNVICAGGKNTKRGFCQGDSGGPLVCDGQAVGIVSYNNGENCDYVNDVPNVYTDVFEYISWIEREKKKCKI